jgi:FkbH-like protein
LLPRIKAIVLDLDNTLYSGVLGEDGPQGVELTGAHRDLQAELLRLRENGIFLALASRNEIEDVERLFSDRKDFLLKKEHFSTTRISWEPKATGIASVISNLRIGADAVLFIDDNPGEIAATAAEIPGLKFLHASSAEATSRALKQYPGISGRKLEHADSLRVSDMAANELRAELLINSSDPIEYLTSLCAELTLSLNPEPFIRRISELSNKTNQFNTNFARLTEAEISRRLADPVSRIVSIALLDRLSDSGLIGMIAGRIQENELLIDDLCISCRALGRHLEDIMITEAISAMADDNKVETIAFAFKEGPRNRPAREWLAKYTGFSEIGDVVKIPWHPDTALNPIRSAPVKIRWE